MLPAVGQGALAIECRAGDDGLAAAARAAARSGKRGLRHRRARDAGGARRLLPHADRRAGRLDGDRLVLEGLLLKPDGSAEIRGRRAGGIGEAEALGTELGGELRHRAGPGFGLD